MQFDDEWDDDEGFDGVDERKSTARSPAVEEIASMAAAVAAAANTTSSIFSVAKNEKWRQGQSRTTNTRILSVAAGGKSLFISTSDGNLTKWSGKQVSTISVTRKPDERIYKLFVDPSGNHVVFSIISNAGNAPSTYYYNAVTNGPPPFDLSKNLRPGAVVESVGWDRAAVAERRDSDAVSGNFLIGTNRGTVYVACMERNKERKTKIKKFAEVLQLRDPLPISGCEYEFVGTAPATSRYFVMLVTSSSPARFYQHHGGPELEDVFSAIPRDSEVPFGSLPSEAGTAQLSFFKKPKKANASSFALLASSGVFSGKLQYSALASQESVITETNLLVPPPTRGGVALPPPVWVQVTEYHFLLVYPRRVLAISKINDDVIWDFSIEAVDGSFTGTTVDVATGQIWLYSDKAVWEITVENEHRNVWKLYLRKAKQPVPKRGPDMSSKFFDLALEHCSPEQEDEVLTAQADSLFERGHVKLAAHKYARTKVPFEEVALKFINAKHHDALMQYLQRRLAQFIANREQDKTRITIICTWLTELYLDQLNSFVETIEDDTERAEQDAALLSEFRDFLQKHKNYLDHNTTYHLISSHGRVDELLFFATEIGDYERVLTHHMQRAEYAMALNTLSEVPEEKAAPLFYRLSPTLMLEVPVITVKAWKKARFLDPTKLIPALVRYSQRRQSKTKEELSQEPDQAIEYMQYCIQKLGNKDPAIHNYLLSLYARQESEEPLLDFIRMQCIPGGPPPIFDLKYALRVCTREGKEMACVHLYGAMQLYEEAVHLALKKDIGLAKDNANMPLDDEEQQKKLWLQIAQYTIHELKDVRGAINMLHECPLLKIEDILQFFPEYVQIDQFKDEICQSLRDCNDRITDLKDEMDKYTRSAERIRGDITSLRNRFGRVKANQVCELCKLPVLQEQFFLFPCMHAFHFDCLVVEMQRHMSPGNIVRLESLKMQLADVTRRMNADSSGQIEHKDHNDLAAKQQALSTEFDDLVASECLFCGHIMVDSIDQPFGLEEGAKYAENWDV